MPSDGELVTSMSTPMYVDSFLGEAIRTSDSSCSHNVAHVAKVRYAKAILESDIADLRKTCELRGIDYEGLSRYQIVQKEPKISPKNKIRLKLNNNQESRALT